MGLVISVRKIKDALGYLQHVRLSQPDLKDWLNKEKKNLSLMEQMGSQGFIRAFKY